MSTGFALNIDEKLLKNLASADEHIQNIGTHSEQTRDKFNAAFQQMATGSLNDFISKLAEAKRAISDVGSANVQFNGVVNISNQAVKASDDIVNLVSTLAKLKHIMSQMGGENFSAEGLFNMGGQTKEITKELRADLRKTQTWLTKLKEATDAYENSIGNLSANIARAKEAQRSFNEELKRASKQQAGGLINQQGQARTLNELKAYAKELQKTMANLDPKSSEWEKLNKIYKQTNREIKSINSSMKDMNNTHKSLINTADQLKRAFALIFSVSAIRGYVTEIARVRGEFELQQRSLESILQNKDEANKLWQQTIQLAVRSPFQVKELVTYTKQLAAYRVETHKLYDTTKMLADVSAGLGVDMSRLILAYGQVKAANYLRGTELRQFSEAGINILGELAKYFTELEGRTVSVGEVFERVSKRMVTFTDVEKIFKRITSESGIFYNMQEIQAETLKGQISNLRDSIDIMLNDIGKANEGILKSSIGAAKFVVDNWETLIPVLKAVVAGFALTRVNALLAKESIMLMAIDFGVLTGEIPKTLKVTQLLNVGWKGFVKNIKAAATAAKAFAASNPLLLALTAIAAVLIKVGRAIADHKEEIKEINDKYEELANSVRSISNKMVISQKDNNLEQMRGQLLSLIELAKREYNMEINVDVSKLDSTQIANKFIEIREKIFNLQEFSKTFELALQKQAAWKPDSIDIFGDLDKAEQNIQEQLRIFKKAAVETVFEMDKVKDKLSETQLEALDKLRQPQQIDETEFQYVERLRGAYQSLLSTYDKARVDFSKSVKGRNEALEKETKKLQEFGIEAKTISGVLREWLFIERDLGDEFSSFFDRIEKEMPQFLTEEEKELYLKTAIDKQAWSDTKRQLAYYFANQRYPINITPTIPQDKTEDLSYGQGDVDALKVLNKRISLIKDMNKQYEKLSKTFSETVSKEKVIASYTHTINEAFKGTGININKIKFTSMQELLDSLKLLKPIAAKEGTEAVNTLNAVLSQVQTEIDIDVAVKDQNKLKKKIEDLFSRYEISLDFEKLGIDKSIMSKFFDVEYLDMSGLKAQMNVLAPAFKAAGSDMLKVWEQYEQKVAELEAKAQQERLKTYLAYARGSIGERAKIKMEELRKLAEIEKTFTKKEQQPEKEAAQKAVKEESYQKTQKLEWEEFQKTDTFINLFKDLDMASGALIDHAIEKLNEFKDNWKDMPLEDMRSIVSKINELQMQMATIKPFSTGKDLKAQKDSRSLEVIQQENIAKEQKISDNNKEIAQLEEILRLKEEGRIVEEFAHAESIGKGDLVAEETEAIREQIEAKKRANKLTQSEIAANEKQLAIRKQFKRSLEEQANAINKSKDMANDLLDVFTELAGLFADDDSMGMVFTQMGQDMLNTVLNTVALQIQLQAAQIAAQGLGIAMNAAMGIIGWIVMGVQLLTQALSAIFKAHDKDLQNQIDDLTAQTENLEAKFESLEKAVDKAYSTDTLKQAAKDAEKYTKQMIANYEAMIELEKQKKKTDEEKIKEYEGSIAAQREALEDLKQDMLESMGGVTDYRSATQDFVDAWVEAYKECGDGLNGLQDNFTEFFDNLIKQQATMKVTEKFLEPFYDNLNLYLDDYELTKDEMDKLREQAKNIAPELSKYLEELWNILGGSMGETGGSLSGLQAGIQGITESQAEIISAYLNSIRFFVSDNNSVMKQLRDYVIGTEENANPMLAQLRIIAQQTSAMRTLLDSVTQSGHPKGQSGIRVFID